MGGTAEVKIEEKLAELLAVTDRSNAEIADEVGISPSSLTHYRLGQSRPSLDNLIKLSDVFGVSLDYLVFGNDHGGEEMNVDPIIRYVDHSLQDIQVRTAEHTSLVARVGQHISKNLDNEIDEFLSQSSQHHHSGAISDTETLSLEQHSQRTKLALRNFDYNLLDTTCDTPGRFFMTVANNLSQGRKYQYLLPKDANDDWSSTIQDFKLLLKEQTSKNVVARSNCSFRVTDAPIVVGFGLYQLREREFKKNNEMLYDFLTEQDYIDPTGRFGYVGPPSMSGRRDAIMDNQYLSSAWETFDRLWEDAEPL
ncbi:helix-turn-helix domain-containing protein [Halocatena marina]|uniref:Helix-turn-helix domain-containing protein n=1 Tax=Halocatena marina TaxID=2934937 RepID=A0ABD5YGE0_9EURY|nr:helix-turn-helix transcriptional regulator [Halocatena marina]